MLGTPIDNKRSDPDESIGAAADAGVECLKVEPDLLATNRLDDQPVFASPPCPHGHPAIGKGPLVELDAVLRKDIYRVAPPKQAQYEAAVG